MKLRKERIENNKEKTELAHYKYNTFLTVKHDILKVVKDQELDKLVAVLRLRKLCKTFIVSRYAHQVSRHLALGLYIRREKRIAEYIRRFRKREIAHFFTSSMKRRYGEHATRALRTARGYLRPALLQAGALHLRTATERARKLVQKCLRERKQILFMKSKFLETIDLITMLQRRLKRIMVNKRY